LSTRHRRHLCVFAGVLLPLTVACAGPPDSGLPSAPHPIIIIDIDTLRADHLGCYGYHRDTSPAIDAFAAESVLFERAFSQAPNTPPSQTSILSGLYPSSHGMIEDDDRVPDAEVTLAEALSNHGLTTAGFHDGGYMSATFNIGQGFDRYESSQGKGLANSGPKIMSWLSEHAEENFLLLIHTYDTHTPYAPPEDYRGLFLDGLAPPNPGFEPTTDVMESIRLSVWTDEPKKLADNDLEYARALYDAEIRYVDTWVGRFLLKVRELGLDRRATIVFISDHGEEFQEHGSVLHEKLYSTVTRIPLMIRLPGGSPAHRVTEVVETIDLMPTLLDLVGAPHPEDLQGSSLAPLLAGGAQAEGMAFGESPFFGHRRFAATGSHQLLLTKRNGDRELYDFVADPRQQNDLAAADPGLAQRLSSEIMTWEERVAQTVFEAEHDGGELDPETEQQLRELGYIQD
jgi:arylsulfatase A-like enzyme